MTRRTVARCSICRGRRRRPSWFWPTLLGSALCAGFGAGETFMTFQGNGSILIGLGLLLVGLHGFSWCWPWMWEER